MSAYTPNLPALIDALPGDAEKPPQTGFYRALQVEFVEHLSVTGSVRSAASQVGVSHQSAYRARRSCRHLRLAWDAALIVARANAADVLACRAIDGMEEKVFYHGEQIATRTRYSDRLLLAHLARLDRLAESAEAAAYAEDWDGSQGRFGRGEEPVKGVDGVDPATLNPEPAAGDAARGQHAAPGAGTQGERGGERGGERTGERAGEQEGERPSRPGPMPADGAPRSGPAPARQRLTQTPSDADSYWSEILSSGPWSKWSMSPPIAEDETCWTEEDWRVDRYWAQMVADRPRNAPPPAAFADLTDAVRCQSLAFEAGDEDWGFMGEDFRRYARDGRGEWRPVADEDVGAAGDAGAVDAMDGELDCGGRGKGAGAAGPALSTARAGLVALIAGRGGAAAA